MRQLGIASAIYGVSILLSRLIGLVRESIIGRTLGQTGEADVYWSAFVIPDFLNYLLAGGVLSLVFIPIFQGYLARNDEDGAWRAFSVIGTVLGCGVTALTVVAFVATPTLVPWLFPGLTAEQHILLTRLVRIILPAQVFHLTGGLIAATLQARDRHLMPALAPLVYTGGIVGVGLALGHRLGAEAFAWGVLLGSVAGPFGLPLAGALKHGLRYRASLYLGHPDLRRYLWLSLPIMLGFSVVVLDDMVIKHHASRLAEGVISRLQYAKTLMKVPMGVFGLATGIAAYPTLARLIAQGETQEAARTLRRALRAMLVLAFTAQAGLSTAGAEIAAVVWGTRRFPPEALAEIGLFTAIVCLGLWAWAAQSLIARAFYASNNTWLPTLVGSVVMAAAFPLYGYLAGEHGAAGLAAASAIAISAYVAALALLLRWRLGLIELVCRMAAATGAGVAAGLALERLLPTGPALIVGGAKALVAMVITVGVAQVLRVEEVAVFRGLLRRATRTR